MPCKVPLTPFIGRRKRRKAAPVSNAPVLVAAEFLLTDGAYVVLTFDRAVDVSGLVLGAFVVLRHPSEEMFEGASVELTDPMTVKVGLSNTEAADPGPDIVMNVASDNGIVAADGGEAWAGAADVELPFP